MSDHWFLFLICSIGAFIVAPYGIWSIIVATAQECWERRWDGETLRILHNATAQRVQHIEETLGHPIEDVIAAATHEESQGGNHAVVKLFRSWKLRVRHEANGTQGEVRHVV